MFPNTRSTTPAIPEPHPTTSKSFFISTYPFLEDGSSILIGPLNFIVTSPYPPFIVMCEYAESGNRYTRGASNSPCKRTRTPFNEAWSSHNGTDLSTIQGKCVRVTSMAD
ncbi:hypothetical protein AVEN_184611-1 [Araneus ventricosus]|uniref:Uncharacterized protein n=1 Tax=Araneus ventricosus TaxID=182803 RepID=A0A4Y2EB02_ARAVE|nr:hypothetical protein AVEN_184611-1 [Araneus ventricosus]